MKKQLLFILLLFSSTISLWAVKVEGVVFDEKKEPIIGATIIVKETKVGTITDINGKFKIEVEDISKSSLVISYLGYKKKFLPLEGKTMLTIFMEPDNNILDEVVVVGYGGSMKKSDLTGAVTSVKTTQEEAARNTTFDKMLQGKAAGVTVTTSNSAPGGGVNIRIRGSNSLRGDNSPLYVVDGVFIDVDQTPDPMAQGNQGGNSLAAAQNPLSAISPQDIENIEILKDASATAIYGSRGANGVVLITTKKGASAKPTVTLSSTLTLSQLTKEINVLNTADYVKFYNEMNPNSPKDLATLVPVNWQKESTRNALSQNHRASVAGKTGKNNYFISAGYLDNQGIIQKTGIQQYDMRVNLTQEINKYINFSLNTSYSNLETSMTSGTDKLSSTKSSVISHMILFHPYKNPTAVQDYVEDLTGPDAWFSDYDDDSRENQFMATGTLEIKPLSWFTIQLKQGLVDRKKERSMWYGTKLYAGASVNGKAGLSSFSSYAYNTNVLLQFNKKITQKHSLNGTIGMEYLMKDITSESLTGEGFASETLRAKGISNATTQYPYVYSKQPAELFSVFGRAIYNFDERIIATATYRADGSSRFAPGNKFSYFPSASVAWRMNNESFMKDIQSISNMKLRLGWGQVGNQAIDPFQTLATYGPNDYVSTSGSLDKGLIPLRIANPNLKWETTEQYNIGLDLGFFNQRLSFIADVYQKRTKDLLQEIALPASAGFQTMWINRGVIENKGLELSVDATPFVNKKWKWSVGGNISFMRSKILDLGLPLSDIGMLKNVSGYLGANVGNNNNTKFPANIFIVGGSLGNFIGYQTNGIIPLADPNDPNATQTTVNFNGRTLTAGDIYMVDQNGDGTVNEADRVIIGNPNPDFTFALNTNLSFSNLSLDMTFNGVVGNDIINANLIDQTDVGNALKNIRKEAYFNAWNATTNPTGNYPRLGSQALGVLTDRLIEDGSYFKLSNITLSYLLKLPKQKVFNSLTFSASTNNVFIITKYSGYDPDVNSFGGDTDRMGIDLASYPSSRSFIFGITATF